MRKLYEIFRLLWIQKRIVAAATIWGNTVCIKYIIFTFSEIDHLEKNIKDAKETNLSFALDIENANARNEQLVAEYNDLEAKTNQAEIGKFHHESNIREKDGAILRNQDIIRAVRLRISQLESESQGTIHILRKHL